VSPTLQALLVQLAPDAISSLIAMLRAAFAGRPDLVDLNAKRLAARVAYRKAAKGIQAARARAKKAAK
jgi:hypothetical protein